MGLDWCSAVPSLLAGKSGSLPGFFGGVIPGVFPVLLSGLLQEMG